MLTLCSDPGSIVYQLCYLDISLNISVLHVSHQLNGNNNRHHLISLLKGLSKLMLSIAAENHNKINANYFFKCRQCDK